jgi:hypothetical protein
MEPAPTTQILIFDMPGLSAVRSSEISIDGGLCADVASSQGKGRIPRSDVRHFVAVLRDIVDALFGPGALRPSPSGRKRSWRHGRRSRAGY